MKIAKEPIRIKIVTGEEAKAVRKQRYESVLVRIGQRIKDAPFSEEEIMAEVKAFRDGK